MSFDWESAAEGNAGIPEGYHRVKCVKVMRANKDGKKYESQKGDPQIYTVWQTRNDEEGLAIFTLSPSAAFTLAGMLKACGANLKRMQDEGVTPASFADQAFAEKQLVNRECWVYAEKKGKYTNLDFVEAETVPDAAMRAYNLGGPAPAQTAPHGYAGSCYQDNHDALEDSDIPF